MGVGGDVDEGRLHLLPHGGAIMVNGVLIHSERGMGTQGRGRGRHEWSTGRDFVYE